MSDHHYSRREMLKLGCAALGSTTLFSSLVHLGAASSASALTLDNLAGVDKAGANDYRALICILLAGGNDSFNMLVPTSTGEFSEYQSIRGNLALDRSSLLPLAGTAGSGRTFGVHPGLQEVAQLYDRGDLAFVANVGTLVEPVTLADINSGVARLPLGLYSHSDQIAHWQTALPDRRSASGWGGRLADALAHLNSDQRVSMSISLAGTNVFQSGAQTVEFSVTPSGAAALDGYGGDSPIDQLRSTALDGMMNDTYKNLFERAYSDRLRSAVDANRFFGEALAISPTIATPFSNDGLAQSLNMIARTIAAREALGQRRQTFFVLFGGWDHHDRTLASQNAMLPALSRGLGELHAALSELNVLDQVTTFTISDFGRTLTSNGDGSDHGWGGHQMVMGGAVQGGKIYGEYPRVFAGNPLDTGRGRLIPTLSVDEYFAELALWLGADTSSLDSVLPNLGRFYSPSSGTAPVGFLAA